MIEYILITVAFAIAFKIYVLGEYKMIKSLKSNRINIDKRGKITTGIKKTSSSGQEYPSTTDYFVIDQFPELKIIYGEKPKKLVVVFPTDVIEDFFSADYVLYGSNNAMIRKCDGVECIHRIDEELSLVGKFDDNGEIIEAQEYKKRYVAGELSECACKLMPQMIKQGSRETKNKKLCSCAFYMKAYIMDFRTKKIISPLCYLFYSGSENSAANIYSELKKIHGLVGGGLIRIPFGLSVDMVAGRTSAKIKYPIWNLQALSTMEQLEKAAEKFLDYKEMMPSIVNEEKTLTQGSTEEKAKVEQSTIQTPSIEDVENPEWYKDQIKNETSYTKLIEFGKKNKQDISFFDLNTQDEIEQLFNSRMEELKK